MDAKLKLRYWIDIVLLIAILGTAVTGLINLFLSVLLSSDHLFFKLSPENWRVLHASFGITTVTLALLHLSLHFDWLVFATKKIFGNVSKTSPKN